jgi:hypothetical protein
MIPYICSEELQEHGLMSNGSLKEGVLLENMDSFGDVLSPYFWILVGLWGMGAREGR